MWANEKAWMRASIRGQASQDGRLLRTEEYFKDFGISHTDKVTPLKIENYPGSNGGITRKISGCKALIGPQRSRCHSRGRTTACLTCLVNVIDPTVKPSLRGWLDSNPEELPLCRSVWTR
ncbi:hypothetical protein VTN77DRAFT_5900 [Rasamsonia byssochlamydoides]|uniref:uncharacterized protein n=1 Tax=Rasamsonia byssochlamydoides TaxID=89139 RepID=UPI0037441870